jgi:Ca2+-binding RTX toxin-like protein
MATKIESGNTTFDANIANETFVMGVEALLTTAGGQDGINAGTSLGGRVFRIAGNIDAGQVGISVNNDPAATADKIFIGATGVVAGTDGGIVADSGHVEVENKGWLTSDFNPVVADCETFLLRNSGVIETSGDTAVISSGDFTTLINAGSILAESFNTIALNGEFELINSGLIQSLSADAIRLAFTAEASGKIVNNGTIIADDDAIVAGAAAANIKIINRGNILGDVDLTFANGTNVIDNRDGRIVGNVTGGNEGDKLLLHKDSLVTGTINGDTGDDIYVVSNPNLNLVEGAGADIDTVRSFVSFSFAALANFENLALLGTKNINATGNAKDNLLTGNSGKNQLNGDAGIDTLRGGKGNDTLTGGSEADVFIYKTGDGKDVITDMTVTADQIDLTGLGVVTSINDLFNNHLFTDGDDVLVKGSNGDLIRLTNVVIEELSADNFIV